MPIYDSPLGNHLFNLFSSAGVKEARISNKPLTRVELAAGWGFAIANQTLSSSVSQTKVLCEKEKEMNSNSVEGTNKLSSLKKKKKKHSRSLSSFK